MTRITPPPFQHDAALAEVWDALPEARVVGGAVRDALAGRPVADIDLATPRSPDGVIQALTQAGIRAVATGLAHGTITAVAQGRGFEVTTLRRDVETDGRHAIVAFTDDWQEDAARRDFTINAMSMTRDGSIHDYFGGTADLVAGRLRFVGDPATRIAEDYLRILRYFRFYARYAAEPPDIRTEAALRGGVDGIRRLSVERVWHELRLILATPDPLAAVVLMDRLSIWQAVMPEAMAIQRLEGMPPDPILRVAAMMTGDGPGLAMRLKFSNEDRDRLLRLISTPSIPAGADDATLRRLLADHQKADLLGRSLLDRGDPAMRARLEAMDRPIFPLEGRDVLAEGQTPGPAVGIMLRAIRQWWLEDGCVANRAACLAELARRVKRSNIPEER